MSAHIGVDMYASCLRPFVLGEPLSKHNSARSAVKTFFMALRAKLKFETDVFFESPQNPKVSYWA